ncbi:MAG: glycosyltransferase family 1 protein [Deltaproteobacteria bacterium]|nr:glycosyltransferase family 1 protein [Deltaproteobacteria bacterium]
MLKRLLRKITSRNKGAEDHRILNYFPLSKSPKGHVLVSYIPDSLLYREGDKRFKRHSNAWESAEIARIFNRYGYSVDAISWDDRSFVPERYYTAVFDIHRNLLRCSSLGTHKIFHVTGSDPAFSNRAEQERIDALMRRRGVAVAPRRYVSEKDLELFYGNLENADSVTLIGNETTVATFPHHLRHKMILVTPTGSHLETVRDAKKTSFRKEFLWFNGTGAVHKGLDLVLEVFARNPKIVLHVVGPYRKERDFTAAYAYELTKCPNIFSHGFLSPSSRKFRKIAGNVLGCISPSCSEGISTSAITCMQYGMVPILSRNSGIDLTPDVGYLLQNCTIVEIEAAILSLLDRPEHEIRGMIATSQEFALKKFSRAEFSRRMGTVVARSLPSV